MTKRQSRNWVLLITATLVIIICASLLLFSVLYARNLGTWPTIGLITLSVSGITCAITAIVRNDPAWLMLELLIPY